MIASPPRNLCVSLYRNCLETYHQGMSGSLSAISGKELGSTANGYIREDGGGDHEAEQI